MIVFEGKTVNDVWEQAFLALKDQAEAGFTDSSRDGAVVGEFLDAVMHVADPTRNIVSSPIRNMPMRYAVGELAWYLSGSNKVNDIAQYAKKWAEISDDGETNNSAYGYRIFHKFGFDQWEYVKELIRKDRSNDIWMGVPYDMFSFCFLQVKMAMELGVEVGEYTHYAGSLHMYQRDYNAAIENWKKAAIS